MCDAGRAIQKLSGKCVCHGFYYVKRFFARLRALRTSNSPRDRGIGPLSAAPFPLKSKLIYPNETVNEEHGQ